MIAYLLTSGSYSDYTVHMVFTSKEVAEATCEKANLAGALGFQVEEVSLLDAVPNRVTMYYMSETQGLWTRELWEHELSDYNLRDSINVMRRTHPVVVRGTDKERVQKVYSDIMAERKAHEEGLA